MSPNDKPVGRKIGWHHLGTKKLFSSKFWNARQDQVRLPNGRERNFTYIEHPGAVFIVPVTRQGKIILLHQYRYTIDDWCWEIVAGGLGDKPGKTPADVAKEELAEEIGVTAGRLEPLGTFNASKGIADITHHYFIAYDVVLDQEIQREETEIIDQVKDFSLNEVMRMIHAADFIDADTTLAMLLAEPILQQQYSAHHSAARTL